LASVSHQLTPVSPFDFVGFERAQSFPGARIIAPQTVNPQEQNRRTRMGLFSKSTEPDVVERALRREIDAARKSEGRLAADLVKWQSAVERRKAAAEALARDDGADDDKIDAAVASTGGAQDRVDNASASLASVRDALAVLEAKHAQEVDRAQRDQTASTIELLARELAEACEAMDKAAVVVANVTARAFPVAPEAGGLHQLAIICHTELPAASDLITRLLRERGRAVIAGTAPAILKTPDAGPNTPPTAAEPVTTQMFALRSIKWRDANGRQIVAQNSAMLF
jgi:hypothetical protein